MIGLGHTWMAHAADSSFPSDHMTVFGGIGLTLLFGDAVIWGIAILVAGLCVSWSRVFVGVHFPLDILGSVGVATVSLTIAMPLWRWLGTPITSFFEHIYRHILTRVIVKGWIRG